jgi:hypothetical protein
MSDSSSTKAVERKKIAIFTSVAEAFSPQQRVAEAITWQLFLPLQ